MKGNNVVTLRSESVYSAANREEFKNACLYIRVSTEKQEELSPDSQRRLLLDYAKSHNMFVSEDHIYMENGISGRKADKRPAFQKMIATAKSEEHPFDVILVWKFSRFARNQEESIVYKSMLRNKCGVDVVSISEPLIEGPFGSLIERIIEWMDEFYSTRLAGDVTRGMTENAMRGAYQCRPPLGYRIPYHKATPEIVPEGAEIVRLIFEKYVNDNMSIFAIVKLLNQLGYKTSHGKPFEKRSVEYILQNQAYAGEVCWGKVCNETKERRDPSEWIRSEGKHPPIIDKQLFEAATKRYNSEYRPRNSKPAEVSKHWLSGMLKCPKCGRSLSSCLMPRKTLPPTYSFQCYGYLKGKCDCNCYVRNEVISPLVISALEDTLKKGTVIYRIKPKSSRSDSSRKIETLRKGLDRISAKEKRVKEAYLDGIDSKDEYKENKARLQAERSQLEAELEELLRNSFSPTNQREALESIANVLDIIKSDNFSIQEKNASLRSIVEKIVYSKDDNTITVDYL